MCLISKTKEYQIADHDIEVWKVLRRTKSNNPKYTAPYMCDFEYGDLNGEYFDDGFFDGVTEGRGYYAFTNGFHTFKNMFDAIDEMDRLNNYAFCCEEFEVVPCIIPQGSAYIEGYENHTAVKSYCSSKIKLNY